MRVVSDHRRQTIPILNHQQLEVKVRGLGATYHLQAVVNRRLYVQTIEAPILRCNVYVLSCKSALPQCFPDLFLIAVYLSGICQRCIVPISQTVSQTVTRFRETVSYKRTDMTESHG